MADRRAATPTHASELVIPRKDKILDDLQKKMEKIKKIMDNSIEVEKRRLRTYENSYIIKNYPKILENKNRELIDREERLNSLIKGLLEQKINILELKKHRLLGVNPQEVLKRGYTITLKNGTVVKDKNSLCAGEQIDTVFYNGKISSTVKE